MMVTIHSAAMVAASALAALVQGDNQVGDGWVRFSVTTNNKVDETGDLLPLSPRQYDLPTTNDFLGSFYTISVGLGNPSQPITLLLDTGSADLWVNPNCATANTAGFVTFCNSQPRYTPGKTAIDTGASWNLTYGSGWAFVEYYEDFVNLGGAQISGQIFGVGIETDHIQSGLLGIGPVIPGALLEYPRPLDTLKSQGLIATRAFTLDLRSIDSPSGSLIFGGVDTGKYIGALAKRPIVDVPGEPRYWVTCNGVSSTNSAGVSQTLYTSSAGIAVLLDSGGTLSRLPTGIFNAIVAAVPGATPAGSGFYTADCALANQPGSIGFTFGTKTIQVAYKDLLWQLSSGICIVGVLAEPSDTEYVLGDSFLRAAYVVFDADNSNIHLAQAADCGTNIIPIGSGANAVPSSTGLCGASTSSSASSTASSPSISTPSSRASSTTPSPPFSASAGSSTGSSASSTISIATSTSMVSSVSPTPSISTTGPISSAGSSISSMGSSASSTGSAASSTTSGISSKGSSASSTGSAASSTTSGISSMGSSASSTGSAASSTTSGISSIGSSALSTGSVASSTSSAIFSMDSSASSTGSAAPSTSTATSSKPSSASVTSSATSTKGSSPSFTSSVNSSSGSALSSTGSATSSAGSIAPSTHTSNTSNANSVTSTTSNPPIGTVSTSKTPGTSPVTTSSVSTLTTLTSTMLSTTIYTITSCAPTVTNCPLGSVTTAVITAYTTYCPVASSVPAKTSTIYSTTVYTVTACPVGVSCLLGTVTSTLGSSTVTYPATITTIIITPATTVVGNPGTSIVATPVTTVVGGPGSSIVATPVTTVVGAPGTSIVATPAVTVVTPVTTVLPGTAKGTTTAPVTMVTTGTSIAATTATVGTTTTTRVATAGAAKAAISFGSILLAIVAVAGSL